MRTFDEVEAYIGRRIAEIETQLVLADMTIEHGLHSFRFGSSGFLPEIFAHIDLKPGKVFYDLGSGYGNVLFYGAMQFPKVQFKGIEILAERNTICETIVQKTGLANVEAIRGNILETDFSDGDVFYIFNPLFDFQYDILLEQLHDISLRKPVTVVAESRCDVFDRAEWLKHYRTTDIDILRRVKYYRSSNG
jgi:hypothetical protein